MSEERAVNLVDTDEVNASEETNQSDANTQPETASVFSEVARAHQQLRKVRAKLSGDKKLTRADLLRLLNTQQDAQDKLHHVVLTISYELSTVINNLNGQRAVLSALIDLLKDKSAITEEELVKQFDKLTKQATNNEEAEEGAAEDADTGHVSGSGDDTQPDEGSSREDREGDDGGEDAS